MDHLRWKVGALPRSDIGDPDEILDKEEERAIREFLKDVVRDGQKLHKMIQDKREWVAENVRSGDKITTQQLLKAIHKITAHQFGNDELGRALSKAITTGEGFF